MLAGVRLDVPPESCVAVVGESGSGKTTLARCIAGLHSNWTGEITFRGAPAGPRAPGSASKDQLKRVQYIFQNPYTSLNPRKTVGQIVAQPLEQFEHLEFRERSERVIQVLEDVSLSADFLSRYPDQLSGGERQRVAIARALVVQPDLLICDEVTSSLDVSVQAIIVELLRRIQRERQLAMIFITHNLALVRSIAQSAVVLHAGTVVESGPVEQILTRPADPYTMRLIEDVPKLAAAYPGAAGSGGAVTDGQGGPAPGGSAGAELLQRGLSCMAMACSTSEISVDLVERRSRASHWITGTCGLTDNASATSPTSCGKSP